MGGTTALISSLVIRCTLLVSSQSNQFVSSEAFPVILYRPGPTDPKADLEALQQRKLIWPNRKHNSHSVQLPDRYPSCRYYEMDVVKAITLWFVPNKLHRGQHVGNLFRLYSTLKMEVKDTSETFSYMDYTVLYLEIWQFSLQFSFIIITSDL
jgi:hypothetical protein